MGRWKNATMSWRVVALVLAVLLVVAACSGGDSAAETFSEIGSGLDDAGDGAGGMSTGTTVAASEEAPSEGEDSSEGEEATDEDDLGSGGVTPVALPIQIGRDIIFTAEMTLAVTDVAGAGEEATREIASLGGFLFGQHTTGSPDPTTVLTFKVQPEDFQTALAALGSIGEVRSQSVTASDVTERIVDLESRIATAAASVERLRALLAEATDIEAVVELESELLVRETELETLRGSLRTLQDQVALATIVLTPTEAASNPELTLAVTAYPAHDSGQSCPGTGEMQVETGTETTVCFEIANTGDTWLADFELRDPVLDIELADLVLVFGDPGMALEPGDTILLAAEVVPDRDLRMRTTVTAQPVDEDGETIPGRPASQTTSAFVNAVDPGGIASFSDGLEASWELLVRIGQVLVLALGALLPFIWIPILAWFIWRWRRPAGAEGP
jgi:hypothetical protein